MVGSLFLTFVVICVLEDYNYAGAFFKNFVNRDNRDVSHGSALAGS